MILGSHNSLTYLKPTSRLQRLITFTWRCQRKEWREQWRCGVRCFDIRVRWRRGEWVAAHGGACFRFNFLEMLSFLNTQARKDRPVYVRLVYEGEEKEGGRFALLCWQWAAAFPRITFFGGRQKKGWKLLYFFDVDPAVSQYVSSMRERCALLRILPKRYARRHNAQNTEAARAEGGICLFDYVGEYGNK